MINNNQRVNQNKEPIEILRLVDNLPFWMMHLVKISNLSKIESKSYEIINKIDYEKGIEILDKLHLVVWIVRAVKDLIVASFFVNGKVLRLNVSSSDKV